MSSPAYGGAHSGATRSHGNTGAPSSLIPCSLLRLFSFLGRGHKLSGYILFRIPLPFHILLGSDFGRGGFCSRLFRTHHSQSRRQSGAARRNFYNWPGRSIPWPAFLRCFTNLSHAGPPTMADIVDFGISSNCGNALLLLAGAVSSRIRSRYRNPR